MKLKRLMVLILALAFMFSFAGCKSSTSSAERVAASEGNFVMEISINPDVEFVVDSETGVVTDVVCLNSDAEDLINKLNLNLIGLSYDEASETFMKACADEGYLNESNNNITISADGEASDGIYETYGEKMGAVSQSVDDYTDFEITVDMTCFPCHGTGNCDLCNGAGGYTCTECNGAGGHTACSVCGGSGVVTCESCGGAGCEACNNSGTQSCLTCTGTGKVCCFRCNSTGTETCPRCDGSGKCNTCHGAGTLTEDQLIP